MLIAKRDTREKLVFMSMSVYRRLRRSGSQLDTAVPLMTLTPLTNDPKLRKRIVGTTLEEFMRLVSRDNVEKAAEAAKEKK